MYVLDEHHPTWIEEPLHAEAIEGYAELQRQCATPIATAESLFRPAHFVAYLKAGAVDVLQPDIVRVGGITPWLEAAHLCGALGSPRRTALPIVLSAQVLCAVPNVAYVENVLGGSLSEVGLTSCVLAVERGWALPSETPGCGVA